MREQRSRLQWLDEGRAAREVRLAAAFAPLGTEGKKYNGKKYNGVDTGLGLEYHGAQWNTAVMLAEQQPAADGLWVQRARSVASGYRGQGVWTFLQERQRNWNCSVSLGSWYVRRYSSAKNWNCSFSLGS